MTENQDEVIDLVAMFRATQRQHRVAVAANAVAATFSWWIAVQNPGAFSVAVAVAVTALTVWAIPRSLRKLAELKALIANPHWSKPGVRASFQTRVDDARAQKLELHVKEESDA